MDSKLSLLYSRRSIRKYLPEQVPQDLLTELLMAAMAAPSAHDARPWEFLVITDPRVKRQIKECHPYARFAEEAGAVIVVFGDQEKSLFEHSLAAATQNILLAATGLGLGSCWCGMSAERQEPVREITGIPQNKWIVSLVCVGYAAEQKEPRTLYDASRVHWQRYSGE